MATEQDIMALETWFDSGQPMPADLKARVSQDAELQESLRELQLIRDVLRGQDTPRIEDAQFRTFMDGIRQEMVPAPRGVFARWWSLASLAAASFLIALSVFYIGWGDPAPVRATEVESVSTELEGATTDFYGSENGTATIWINLAEDDL
ncbi:MAG: hypothetical protein GC168_12880 [Candidatus Hydrogenedens sp.]|nr:hypothetical protein [Candidatus Hydrogenedens sp.]